MSTMKQEDHAPDQLDLMRALRIISLLGGAQNSSFKAPKEPEDITLKTYDWISLFFVKGNRGDVSAMALKIKQDDVTLFVSPNRGIPDDFDEGTGTAFLDALWQVLRHPEWPLLEKTSMFTKLLLQRIPSRIQFKISLLSDVRAPQTDLPGSRKTYDYLIESISEWSKDKAETSPGLTKWASDSNGLCHNANEALKECVKKIYEVDASTGLPRRLTTIPDGEIPKGKVLFPSETEDKFNSSYALFLKIVDHIRILLHSDFFIEVRRVADNAREAGVELDPKYKFLEKIEWIYKEEGHPIAPSHGEEYLCAETSREYVDQRMEHLMGKEWTEMKEKEQDALKIYARQKKANKNKDASEQEELKKPEGPALRPLTNESLNRGWKKGTDFKPVLHCELRLLDYLMRNDIDVRSQDGIMRIGVSKLSCLACHTQLRHLKASHPYLRELKVKGTSAKAQELWAAPDPESFVTKRTVNELVIIQDTILMSAIHTKGHLSKPSAGSDSSAGSNLLGNAGM